MQFSNGLTDPVGLWLGHLMFDTIAVVVLSTIITIIFATVSNQFHGLGFLVSFNFSTWDGLTLREFQWFILILYGITAALFSYCISLMVASPLAAFATVAGYQFAIFIVSTALSMLDGLAEQYLALYFFLPPRFNVWKGHRIC